MAIRTPTTMASRLVAATKVFVNSPPTPWLVNTLVAAPNPIVRAIRPDKIQKIDNDPMISALR